MKLRIGVLGAVCLLSMAQLVGAQSEMVPPKWTVGEQWRVSVVYPSPVQEGAWSQPYEWVYKVMSSDESGIVVVVSNVQGEERARLWFGSANLALKHAEVMKRYRGESVSASVELPASVPAVTEQSPVPFDSPILPLVPGTSTEYQVTKPVAGDLHVVEKIRQTVQRAESVPDALSGWSGADLVEVVCTREDGSTGFRQYWDSRYPWPVYGENNNMKYWLILP